MKKLFPILFILFFIFSCDDKIIKEVKEIHENGKPKVVELFSEKDSVKELIKTEKYNLSNQLISEEFHLKEQLIEYSYHTNGNIRTILDGNPDISYMKMSYYHKEGPLNFYGEVVDFTRHGRWSFYYLDETLEREEFYNKGDEITKEEWENLKKQKLINP